MLTGFPSQFNALYFTVVNLFIKYNIHTLYSVLYTNCIPESLLNNAGTKAFPCALYLSPL